MHPQPIAPQPGQESVWDYPRPPRLEPVRERLRVAAGGLTVADTLSGFRVLETSHPPVYYFPPDSVAAGVLRPAAGGSLCEWKGRAVYFDLVTPARTEAQAAWAYPRPTAPFAAIAGFVAFYAGRVDACFVGDERVTPQPGGFYGGWVTARVVGPFKGVPGSIGW